MENNIGIIIGLITGIIIGYLISKIYYRLILSKERKEAIYKSKSVVLGQVSEKIAPLLPEFKYNFKDLTFIGKGIDYIIFDGLSEGNLKQVIFLEIKTGKSNLNGNEKQIKKVIDSGSIHYEIMKIN